MRGSFLVFVFFLASCGRPWVPTGSPQSEGDPSCDVIAIQSALMQLSSPEEQMNWISGLLKKCAAELPEKRASSLYELYQSLFIQYDYQQLRSYYPLLWTDRDGRKLRGELFLKIDPSTGQIFHRPLVIYQCGIGCDLADSSMRLAVMILFDESPFHLLALPSSTSISYQRDNAVSEFGGFLEGEKLLGVVDYVRSTNFPFREAMGSVHLVGVSLGGQAVMYAALYDSVKNPKVASFHAGCPVVDLEASLVELFRPTTLGNIFSSEVIGKARSLVSVIPFFGDLLYEYEHLLAHERASRFISESAYWGFQRSPRTGRALSILASLPSEEPPRALSLPNEEKLAPNESEFWRLHQFQSFAPLVKRPLYVWGAEDDEVVKSSVNIKLLMRQKSATTGIVLEPRGNHCLFYESMGWRRFGSLWRSTVISQSPELRQAVRFTHLRLADYDWPTGFQSTRRVRRHQLDFSVKWNDDYVRLRARGARTCGPGHNRSGVVPTQWCRFESKVPFRYETLGLTNGDLPENPVEAQALTRYLNANVTIRDSSGSRLQRTETPRFLIWPNYSN